MERELEAGEHRPAELELEELEELEELPLLHPPLCLERPHLRLELAELEGLQRTLEPPASEWRTLQHWD